MTRDGEGDNLAQMLEVLEGLKDRHDLFVIESGRARREMSFAQLRDKVEEWGGRLATLRQATGLRRLAICARSDLNWLILDLACLRAGVQSIAVPDRLPQAQAAELLERLPAEVLVHSAEWADAPYVRLFRGAAHRMPMDSAASPFDATAASPSPERAGFPGGIYTFSFTSGTQRDEKVLSLPCFKPERELAATPSRVPERMMIWVPFTHFIQRVLAFRALTLGRNLVLSTPETVIADIGRERPTHMICAPFFYEALARNVARQLAKAGRVRKFGLLLYRKFGIHRHRPDTQLRRLLDPRLLGSVAAPYGGMPIEFKWNGGPISRGALETLDSVGLQVFGTYGISEIGPIASDNRATFRLESVGRPMRELRLSEEGEILVKADGRIRDAERLLITPDGFIHTGDLGRLEGHSLFIEGRADDTIVLKNGKKVRPQSLETAVCGIDGVHRACVWCRDGLRLSAVLVREGAFSEEHYAAAISRLNERLEPHEHIHDFALVESLQVEVNALTHTLKVRRARLAALAEGQPFHRTAAPQDSKP